ncbi:helix-turn-helix domain-containing protein [Rubrivivax rivuli]|uniref:AraC family transcriptional regulator n=1 Tax=Rubrivivax rivuli TaxID=1862385 RepID=A0A437R8D8_9BURK|nr:AraC family transcriptional regulator [Rubrivivax rivuli]RVU43040.1 AraC family transcriptional regulator [Rubrivivax rivuli]
MRITREAIPQAEESLRCLHLALPSFGGSLHRHGHFELTWIERGQGLRWVGDSVEPFFDGDLVLVGSETPHLWATRGAPSPLGCAATVLQFPPDWLQRCRLPELQALAPLLAQAAAGVEVQGRTREQVQRLLAQLPGASAPRRVAVFIEVLSCLHEGRIDLRALSGSMPAPPPAEATAGGGMRRIDRVLNWVEANLGQTLCIDDAAAVAHVSPAAFARFFRREVGKSFTAYVNDARCGWAALQLVQGREPVAQVAQACGFPTLSNFGEQFRRRYGVPPREFRASAGRQAGRPAERPAQPQKG